MRTRSIDLISGALASVIILSSTLSYVAFIFSGELSGTLPYAIGFGLVSAGVMAIVFAAGSSVPFVVAGPDSKPTAVLAIMAAVVVAGMGAGHPSPQTGLVVLAALVLGTFATGAAMYSLGAFRMGQWVRFIPYPVIGGFMAASGWLLATGGLGVIAGTKLAFSQFDGNVAWQHLPQIVSGIAFAAACAFIGRTRNRLAFPFLLVAAIVLVHGFLALSGTSIDAARAAGWLLNVSGTAQLIGPVPLMRAFGTLDIGTIGQLGGEFIALVTVTVTSLLLSLVVIEVEGQAPARCRGNV